MLGLGSVSSLGVGLAVYLDDQFTNNSRRVRTELGLLGKETNDYIDGLRRLESMGNVISSVGERIVSIGYDSYKSYAALDDITNSTRAILGNLSKTDPLYKGMIEQTHALGNEYGILSNEIAKAQLEISKAGWKPKDVGDMAYWATILGAASETQVGGDKGTAVMLSDIINTYSYGAEKAAEVSDILTSAANRSTINVTDFYESLKYSGDVAKQLRIPLKESAAVIATLGNAGIKGSSAGTAYANMLRYLTKAVSPFAGKNQMKVLNSLGITQKDLKTAEGTIRPMGELLDLFREKAMNKDMTTRQAFFTQLFGVRGNRAFEPLLNNFIKDDNMKDASSYLQMLAQINEDLSTNITLTTAKEKLNDEQYNLDRLASTWNTFKQSLGEGLAPIFGPALSKLSDVLFGLGSFIRNTTLGQFIAKWAFLLGGVGMVFLGRMLMYGSRFALMMFTSAGRLGNAFQMGQLASRSINAQLTAASTNFVNNMLRARGLMPYTSAAGMPMIMGRGAGGRFTGGVQRNWMTTGLGTMFGRKGLAFGATLTRFFAPVARLFSLGARLGSIFGVIVRVAGFLGRVFFSWWFVIGDLISTLLTGKGLFEWLWIGLKKLGSFFGIGDGSDSSDMDDYNQRKAEGKRQEGVRQRGFDNSLLGIKPMNVEAAYRKSVESGNKTTLNITINPTTGDKRTQRTIDIDNERSLNDLAIG